MKIINKAKVSAVAQLLLKKYVSTYFQQEKMIPLTQEDKPNLVIITLDT